MEKLSTMVIRLVINHGEESLNVKNPHGQYRLQHNPKLRQRNGWCFFSTNLMLSVEMPDKEMSQRASC